ncbi:hypothetical protein DFS34DRAFT_655532 [Phlyctochytrium arcticum]|nr:hypothetical protein DFS34DRAFT_655532 [Phlyctochytrium arcticum]
METSRSKVGAPSPLELPEAPNDGPESEFHVELRPVGPHERRSFDIATLQQSTASTIISPTHSEPASRPEAVRRSSISAMLSWLPGMGGASEGDAQPHNNEGSPTRADAGAPRSPSKSRSQIGGHGLAGLPEDRHGEGTIGAHSMLTSMHPRKRVSVTDLVNKASSDGPAGSRPSSPKKTSAAADDRLMPGSPTLPGSGQSLVGEAMDQTKLFLLDILSNAPPNTRPASACSSQPDPSYPLRLAHNVCETMRQLCTPNVHGQQFLDAHTYLTLFGAQLAAVLSNPVLVGHNQRKAVERRIWQDVTNFLTTSLGIPPNSQIRLAKPQNSAIGGIAKALHYALQNVQQRGQNVTPVIYHADDIRAEAVELELLQQWPDIGARLGFSGARLRRVPSLDGGEAMDLMSLDTMVREDQAAGKLPLFIISRAGTPVTGEIDSLPGLQSLCEKSHLWLHVEGPALTNLLSPKLRNQLSLIKSAHSFSVELAECLGVIPLPAVVVIRHDINLNIQHTDFAITREALDKAEQQLRHSAYPVRTQQVNDRLLVTYDPHVPQDPVAHLDDDEGSSPVGLTETIQYWLAIQKIDYSVVEAHVLGVRDLVREFATSINASPDLQTFSAPDNLSPYVLFRAGRTVSRDGSLSFDELDTRMELEKRFTEHMFATFPKEYQKVLDLDFVCVSGAYFIRYRPSFAPSDVRTQSHTIRYAVQHLTHTVSCLISTHTQRETFQSLLSNRRELVYIPRDQILSSDHAGDDIWAGMGAVRYTPLYIDPFAESIAPEVVENLDELNHALADELVYGVERDEGWLFRSCQVDPEVLPGALELGNGACLRVGIGSQPHSHESLNVLIDRIVKVGQKLERNPEFVAQIADVIRRGIEEAERQLQTESFEEQPSILRMLPIVGSVLSWWRPEVPRNRVPVAKSFSIATGGPGTPRGSFSIARQDSNISDPGLGGMLQHPIPTTTISGSKTSSPATSPAKTDPVRIIDTVQEVSESTSDAVVRDEQIHAEAVDPGVLFPEATQHGNVSPVVIPPTTKSPIPAEPTSTEIPKPSPTTTSPTPNPDHAVTLPPPTPPKDLTTILSLLISEMGPVATPDSIRDLAQTRYPELDTSSSSDFSTTLSALLDEHAPTDAEIEQAVREILHAHRSNLSELNNRKVRQLLQDKFKKDLKDRVGAIREFIDRVLEEEVAT